MISEKPKLKILNCFNAVSQLLLVHFTMRLENAFGRFIHLRQPQPISTTAFCESAEGDSRLLLASRAIGVKSGAKSAARLPCVWCHAIRHVCFVNEMVEILNIMYMEKKKKPWQYLCVLELLCRGTGVRTRQLELEWSARSGIPVSSCSGGFCHMLS